MNLDADLLFRPVRAASALEIGRPSVSADEATDSQWLQRFSGEIDARTVADFAAALDHVATEFPDQVLLDLTDIEFLGAAGLAELARFCDVAMRDGVAVVVACGRVVARPVEACALDTVVRTYPTVDDAALACQGASGSSFRHETSTWSASGSSATETSSTI